MSYTNSWDNNQPLGSAAANTIDEIFRNLKLDISQRLVSLGVTTWTSADPVGFNNIVTTGATPKLFGGTASLLIRDNGDANTNITILDGGDTTHNRGVFTFDGSSVVANAVNASNTIYNAGNAAGGVTIDWNNGSNQKATLTGNVTFTFSNPQIGAIYTLMLTQDATGNRTVTFPASAHFPASLSTVVTATALHRDVITFFWDGSIYNSGFSFRDITP